MFVSRMHKSKCKYSRICPPAGQLRVASILWLRNAVKGIPGLIGPKCSDPGKMELRGQGGPCLLPAWVLLFLFLHWLGFHHTFHSGKWAESRRACKSKGLA